MEDLVTYAEALAAELEDVPAVIVGARTCLRLLPGGEISEASLEDAGRLLAKVPHIMVNRARTARRLNMWDLPALDLLELFAFVRPARACLPTLSGLMDALSMPVPNALAAHSGVHASDHAASLAYMEDQLLILPQVAERLLSDLASQTYAYRAGVSDAAHMMARAGWRWGPFVVGASAGGVDHSREKGLAPWHALEDWEDEAPRPRPGDAAISADAAEARLVSLTGEGQSAGSANTSPLKAERLLEDAQTKAGQTQAGQPHAAHPRTAEAKQAAVGESRAGQKKFTRQAAYAFTPREMVDTPNVQILEAGTGTGKTLGYIAPASLWAEENGGPVWLSTYTKNLQRQLDQELSRLYPDPKMKARRVVVRKGRENYACLLNVEETMRSVLSRSAQAPEAGQRPSSEDKDQILMGLVARWVRFSRDGDMVGGDFPSWLATYFGLGRIGGLTDRRGECLHSGCSHYRKCFIEKSVRKSRKADLVVANHALVLLQAVLRKGDPDLPTRLVFDEGHHVFDAADSVFAASLSGQEGADLRRWIRGRESGSGRSRGLNSRLEELVTGDSEAVASLQEIVQAAGLLPGEGWLARITGAAPLTAYEKFLMQVRTHILARADGPEEQSFYSLEASLHSPASALLETAEALAEQLSDLYTPMKSLARRLLTLLEEEAAVLETSTRARFEASARSLVQRAASVEGWQAMLQDFIKDYGALTNTSEQAVRQIHAADGKLRTYYTDAEGKNHPTMVDWFSLERHQSRDRDVGFHRHYLDPTYPLAREVLSDAHGVLITSATLRDKSRMDEAEDGLARGSTPSVPAVNAAKSDAVSGANFGTRSDISWRAADMRTGAQHLYTPPRRLSVKSPFDYKAQTRFLVVGDVNKADARQTAAAYGALFQASGGGALGLFTAIQRLRTTYELLAPKLEDSGIEVFAQHVDPLDTPTLVDMFRSSESSCLLGTDAVRDGVDVPGKSLRLLVFDRVPWPRPTLLHKARRDAFGGRFYDEMLTRLKLTQAFGRLVRRASDKGVFVILDGRTPSRLLAGLPDGVEAERVGIKDACEIVARFVGPKA